MVESRQVSKTFNKKRQKIDALEDVSSTASRNDIFGVTGYSGAGESTLVRLVSHLETASNGQAIVDGYDTTNYSGKMMRDTRKDIGMVFQHFSLLNSVVIFKNVAMPLILSKRSKTEVKQRVTEMPESVGLSDKKDQFPNELLGGQEQRVTTAGALVANPKILLCDEVTNALDPITTASILTSSKNVNQTFGITIMMITHEMRVTKGICNRVVVTEKGRVVETRIAKEVFSHPKMTTAQNFVSTVTRTESNISLIRRLNDEQIGDFKDYKIFAEEIQVAQLIINDLIQIYDRGIRIPSSPTSEAQGNTVCYMWLRSNTDQQSGDTAVNQHFKEKDIQFEGVH